jgi:hypothetical protein
MIRPARADRAPASQASVLSWQSPAALEMPAGHLRRGADRVPGPGQAAYRDPGAAGAGHGAHHDLALDDGLRLVHALAREPRVMSGAGCEEDFRVISVGRGQGILQGGERLILASPRLQVRPWHQATPIRTPRNSPGAAPWDRNPHSLGSPLPHGMPKVRNSAGPATASSDPQNRGVIPP